MFRCESCGSGYSAQAASSWEACPRCLAKEGAKVPLSFELGWRRASAVAAGSETDLEVGTAPVDSAQGVAATS
jgi:hypothetical protein